MKEKRIVVLDFGGQYNQLIARRVRQCHVYSEVLPYNIDVEKLNDDSILGFIFTGGPNSAYEESSPHISKRIFELGKPILGICYGAQLIAYELGGEVKKATTSEYGAVGVSKIDDDSKLLKNVSSTTSVFMSHTDYIAEVPEGFKVTSHSKDCPVASFEDASRNIYATQFHPEVSHSIEGQKIIEEFVLDICKAEPTWKPSSFVNTKIAEIREKVKDGSVLLGLSGGVDSSVTAALLSKAIGKKLYCVFVDHGLLRKNEAIEVEKAFSNFDLNFIKVDASDLFLEKLKGVTEPEKKRKIVGATFLEVFEEEAKKLGHIDYFAQGTIYPDRIESGLGISATIKSHHNVGGLPAKMDFKGLIEPLDNLFKDEVRELGTELGLPTSLVNRQPFPGPGLSIRIIGEVTREKIKIVQDADYIFREEVKNAGLEGKINQYFAALSNLRSVGVMGDSRTYDYAIVLRAVDTDNFMTAKAHFFPEDVIVKIADRIVNEVKGVNRVLYDFTSKPPSTIELE